LLSVPFYNASELRVCRPAVPARRRGRQASRHLPGPGRRQDELRGVGRALVQDDRWPEPSTRHTYRQLLDYQILPTFEKATRAGRATRMPQAAVTSGIQRTLTVNQRGPLSWLTAPNLGDSPAEKLHGMQGVIPY
jgi:hypothetical protein